MMQDQGKCGSQQAVTSKLPHISFQRIIAIKWVVEMKKIPVAHFTVECGLLWLMDGAVKNYIRSADYMEMQKSGVICFNRHVFRTQLQNLTMSQRGGKWPLKMNDCACLCCNSEYICNFEREFLKCKLNNTTDMFLSLHHEFHPGTDLNL